MATVNFLGPPKYGLVLLIISFFFLIRQFSILCLGLQREIDNDLVSEFFFKTMFYKHDFEAQ